MAAIVVVAVTQMVIVIRTGVRRVTNKAHHRMIFRTAMM
jgi:hypothetical protein